VPKPPPPPPPRDSDVYALTPQGNAELKSAGTSLTSHELEVLVLVDGSATVAQIVQSSQGIAPGEALETLQQLADRHLNTLASEPSALESGFFSISVPAGFFADQGTVEPEAEHGVASLNQKGYYVRIARRAPQKREVKQGWQPTILVVDDDPDLVKLIRTFFRFEGFGVREAANRAEIMAAFRQPPMPDLVLLDVLLPDANGFDVLARMRQHAVLKSMPVVMITAEATREAVRKGLQAGADGYITKPFEPDCLVTAVRQVLGLAGAS
jgi:two-component system OmpR family response regulator